MQRATCRRAPPSSRCLKRTRCVFRLVGRYAAALDRGEAATAWQTALSAGGWETAETDGDGRIRWSSMARTASTTTLAPTSADAAPLRSVDRADALGGRGEISSSRARQLTRSYAASTRPRSFIDTVKSFDHEPYRSPAMGIGPGDCPPFHGMHDASAAVAGGSIEAVDRILAGTVQHTFIPAAGCITRPQRGRRLLHLQRRRPGHSAERATPTTASSTLDLDVHHGDGTQALFSNDPNVLTVSIHESGRTLFPGSGWDDELGGPDAKGTSLNVPLHASQRQRIVAAHRWRARAGAGRGLPGRLSWSASTAATVTPWTRWPTCA